MSGVPDPFAPAQLWFLTGSQGLYGDDVLAQVADQSRRIHEMLDAASDIPVRIVGKPVLADSDAIRRVMLDANASDACVGVIAWMHTFSPARMWIAGLTALAKRLLHLHTQLDVALPWATIDMDFMNLNQAAHGDRECAVDAVSDAEADALVTEYADTDDVAPELLPGGDRASPLQDGAKIELGLRALMDSTGATAFTTNVEDLGGLRQLPGLAVQRLMADGYGFAGEGDGKTSALLRVLKVIGHGRPGGTSFMEDYTYDLTPGQEVILGAHMLEVCPSITSEQPRIEIHPLGIGDRDDPVRMVFTADPGHAVVLGWSDLGDRFRLVGNEVDVVTPAQPLPALPVARAVWKPLPEWRTSTESWIEAGGPHHTVLSTQLGTDELVTFADMVDTELVLIDASTTRRSLKNELRWNKAQYRLAQGF